MYEIHKSMHSTNNIFQSLLLCWEVVHTLEIWHWTNRQSPCPHRTYSLMREDCLMAFSIIYPFRSCTTDKGSDCFEIWCRLTRWLRIYWESETHFGGWQGGVCFVNEFFLNTCSSFFFFSFKSSCWSIICLLIMNQGWRKQWKFWLGWNSSSWVYSLVCWAKKYKTAFFPIQECWLAALGRKLKQVYLKDGRKAFLLGSGFIYFYYFKWLPWLVFPCGNSVS